MTFFRVCFRVFFDWLPFLLLYITFPNFLHIICHLLCSDEFPNMCADFVPQKLTAEDALAEAKITKSEAG